MHPKAQLAVLMGFFKHLINMIKQTELLLTDKHRMDTITTFFRQSICMSVSFWKCFLSLKTGFGNSCPHMLKRFKLEKLGRIASAKTD